MRECAHEPCTNPIDETSERGRPRRYCSKRCSVRSQKDRAKQRAIDSGETCTVDGCETFVYLTGLCRGHYAANHRKPNRKVIKTCDACGGPALKEARAQRYAATYCGRLCRDYGRYGSLSSKLPANHWARWYGTTSDWEPPQHDQSHRLFYANHCDDCGLTFIEQALSVPSAYCSEACQRRVHRRRRRARETEAPGEFTFSQIMRQYAKQGNRCAYCKQPATGLPDPEHVLPLSRGGRNDMSNLVAACRACNSDKSDMTLTEWAADRERRALPAVDTTLNAPEYRNLMYADPTGLAWRHAQAKQMFELIA